IATRVGTPRATTAEERTRFMRRAPAIVAVVVLAGSIGLRADAARWWSHGEDANIITRTDPSPSLEAPLVFAGYGLNVPERNINDLQGLDLKGAVVVYLSATPAGLPGPLQAHVGSAA